MLALLKSKILNQNESLVNIFGKGQKEKEKLQTP